MRPVERVRRATAVLRQISDHHPHIFDPAMQPLRDAGHHRDQLIGSVTIAALAPDLARREPLPFVGNAGTVDQESVTGLAIGNAGAIGDDTELGTSHQRERPDCYSAHAFHYERTAFRKRLCAMPRRINRSAPACAVPRWRPLAPGRVSLNSHSDGVALL